MEKERFQPCTDEQRFDQFMDQGQRKRWTSSFLSLILKFLWAAYKYIMFTLHTAVTKKQRVSCFYPTLSDEEPCYSSVCSQFITMTPLSLAADRCQDKAAIWGLFGKHWKRSQTERIRSMLKATPLQEKLGSAGRESFLPFIMHCLHLLVRG